MSTPFIIAQITDCHIGKRGSPFDQQYRSAEHLGNAVTHILGMTPRPDVVVATGDLIHEGTREEYEHIRAVLEPLPTPLFLVPGNHDDRDNLRAVFPDHAYLPSGPFLQYTVEDLPLRLIFLDTLIAGETGGELCEERIGWLDQRLAEAPTRPTFVCMHHPPFLTGIKPFDRNRDGQGLIGADALGAVVARHSQIERIVCGHIHRPITTRWNGTTVSVAPSTAHQIELDLGAERHLTLISEPPAVDIHAWLPSGSLVSHRAYVGDYPELLKVEMPA